MIDLEQAIHSYVDVAFEHVMANDTATSRDVSSVAPSSERGPGPRRGLRNGLVAVGVGLAIVVLAAALLWVRSDGDGSHVRPVGTAPAALEAIGPADCAPVTGADDTVLMAVTVTGQHTICVTQNGTNTFTFVDGLPGGTTTGMTPLGEGTWSGGGARTSDGQFYVIANLLNNASALRATFCDGTALDLRPLNDSNPRFVAATFDTEELGFPGLQQLDEAGRPIGAAHDPSPPGGKGTCSPNQSSEDNASTIPPGQYRYARVTGTRTATIVFKSDQSYTVILPTTYEFWIGADDSGRIRTNDGDPTFLSAENEQVFDDSGETMPTLAEHSDRPIGSGDMRSFNLSTLPVERSALLDALVARTHTGPPDNAERLLEGLSDNLWKTYGPTRNSRALVAALSSTPGMDVTRRDGMTIVAADANGVRKEIWFDTDTGEIRRKRQVIVDATIPSELHAPNGTVLEDAVLEVATLVPSTDSTP